MTVGDRVVICSENDEYSGLTGTITGLRKDGWVFVTLDNSKWEIPFAPLDIDLANEHD
jgi:hypothetical protein